MGKLKMIERPPEDKRIIIMDGQQLGSFSEEDDKEQLSRRKQLRIKIWLEQIAMETPTEIDEDQNISKSRCDSCDNDDQLSVEIHKVGNKAEVYSVSGYLYQEIQVPNRTIQPQTLTADSDNCECHPTCWGTFVFILIILPFIGTGTLFIISVHSFRTCNSRDRRSGTLFATGLLLILDIFMGSIIMNEIETINAFASGSNQGMMSSKQGTEFGTQVALIMILRFFVSSFIKIANFAYCNNDYETIRGGTSGYNPNVPFHIQLAP